MNITLALESAIAGGSISLLDGDDEIGHWVGTSDVSKAEDLLINIDTLLSKNNLLCHDIKLIAVSAGPGSFTGIRIGLATALGLKSGLGVSMTSVSALDSIAAISMVENIIAAVPMGRNSVCVQQFEHGKSVSEPRTIENNKLVGIIRRDTQNKYIVHEKLYTPELQIPHVINCGANVAKAVGGFAIKNPNSNIAPLFISKASQ